jgi:sensor histidine kinase YesM
MMPCLILQPIVENAVKHGAMKRKKGVVQIIVEKEKEYVKISVCDNGLGMPREIIEGLKNNTLAISKIGLSNVHRRLCYIYGKDNGLDIYSSEHGTTVNIYIPNSAKSIQRSYKHQA